MKIQSIVTLYQKRGIRAPIFLVVILALFCTTSVAATPKKNSLSMEDAISIAYQNNPSVQEAKQNVRVADAKYWQSKKFDNPELEFEIAKIPNDLGGENTFNSDTTEGSVQFSQPIQTFGKRGLKISIAKDEKIQAELALKNILLDVGREVKEQYTQTLLHQKSIGLARDNMDRAQRLLDQVNIKYNAGKARNHEIARAKLAVAKARNGLLKVENNFKIAVSDINILLGRNMREKVKLKDNLTVEDMEQDFERLLSVALQERSDIQSQEQEIAKKDKELQLSKRQRLPDVNFGIFAEREETLWGLGVGISFEFPIWNQFQEDVKEASIEKETAEMMLDALKREVELDVYKAYQNANLARRSVLNLENAIKEANELLRIITIEYQEGEASFLIYLEGLASYKETKQEYLETLADYAGKLAVLEQAVGGEIELEEKK